MMTAGMRPPTTDDRSRPAKGCVQGPLRSAVGRLRSKLRALILALMLAACRPAYDPDLLPPVPAQTPEPATSFDFPLPKDQFGPYIPYVSGPLTVDTRYGTQNPGVGSDGKCFVDKHGSKIPFNQLYHAGEDWFAIDTRGKVDGHSAAGIPVRAIANGAVIWAQGLGTDGFVLVLVHLLPDGSRVWSAYWHTTRPVVPVGQAVQRGDRVADVFDRGYNSHLHWEVRTFGDGRSLFAPNSAGGRGTCNGKRMAVGYTWDDDLARAKPDFWGYLNPTEFVAARRKS